VLFGFLAESTLQVEAEEAGNLGG